MTGTSQMDARSANGRPLLSAEPERYICVDKECAV